MRQENGYGFEIEPIYALLQSFQNGRRGNSWVNNYALSASLGSQNPAIRSEIVSNHTLNKH